MCPVGVLVTDPSPGGGSLGSSCTMRVFISAPPSSSAPQTSTRLEVVTGSRPVISESVFWWIWPPVLSFGQPAAQWSKAQLAVGQVVVPRPVVLKGSPSTNCGIHPEPAGEESSDGCSNPPVARAAQSGS